MGCAAPVASCAPEISSPYALRYPFASERPEEFPYTDAIVIDRIISGSVWGLSENATEEDLLSMCRKFGPVICVEVFKPQALGDLVCATVLFEEASAAHRAQLSLHRSHLHGKEIRVGWGLYSDEWETSNHFWLYVWISKGTTAQQLFKGFRRAGAPCTDACIVCEPSAEELEGVGGVALRTEQEFETVMDALPWSDKTDFTQHPTWYHQKK